MDFYKYAVLLKEGEICWQVTGKILKKLALVTWVIEEKEDRAGPFRDVRKKRLENTNTIRINFILSSYVTYVT